MRLFRFGVTTAAVILVAGHVHAQVPAAPAPAAAPAVSLDAAKKEFVGYWRIAMDEATIRKGMEASARTSPKLFIDGKLVDKPTDAQRDEYLKKMEKELPMMVEQAKKSSENMLIRYDADGASYRIMKESPIPQIPRFMKGSWELSAADGKVYCSVGVDKQKEKAIVESIGNGEMVLAMPEGRGPAGMTIKFTREPNPPTWATDLKEEKATPPAIEEPAPAPAPAPPSP